MGGAKARAPLQAAADPNSYRTDDSLKKTIVQTSIKTKQKKLRTDPTQKKSCFKIKLKRKAIEMR
jgi:hypothetical protein